MAGKAAQQPAGLITAAGWELRCTAGGSDKYYRVVLAASTVIIHHGRTGSAGNFTVHQEAGPAAARDRALDLTARKEAKGYTLTRETTTFPVAAAMPGRARSGGGTLELTEAAQALMAMFLQVSTHGERSR